ncbi:hypothetical protein NSND_50523 [Nitrospira sp. ND1]|nr:hypothetical protein NSND_50523 [Nitrospira sp. ND1]
MALSRGNLESLGKDNGEGETGSHTSRCCPTMSLPALFRLPSRVHRGYDRRMPSMVPPFTATQAAVLKNFLASPQRPTGTLTYPQLAGFLFSLANGPELIPPSEWIPMVFDDHDAGYDTQAEAEQVLQAMMALYNDCARQYFADRPTLPPGCDIRPAPLDNLEPDAPLSHWAQGFGMGHDYLVEYWDEFTPEELDEALGAALMTLTFFSSASLARAYHEEGKAGTSLAQLAGTVLDIFHDALGEYAHLGRAIYQGRREAGDLSPAPTTGRKVGRNDPCPCGSGSKFKKCCGAT